MDNADHTPLDPGGRSHERGLRRGPCRRRARARCRWGPSSSGRRIVASAGNRPRELRDPSAHAEMLAIRRACEALDDERLSGCDLYVTLEPCTMCAAAISFARIRRVYFAAHDPKGGAVDNGVRFFDQPTCHHAPEVYGGIRESEAAALLREFFEERR